jgi:hypothetical protein
MQATPTPRFIDLQLDVPEFTHVSDAENFLAKIALLTARGHLDIQSAQELSALVKTRKDRKGRFVARKFVARRLETVVSQIKRHLSRA